MSFPQDHASLPNDRRTSLIGRSTDPPKESIRTEIHIHPGVASRLSNLLWAEEMKGVGYSEFLDRACAVAEEQIEYLRALYKRGEELGKIPDRDDPKTLRELMREVREYRESLGKMLDE